MVAAARRLHPLGGWSLLARASRAFELGRGDREAVYRCAEGEIGYQVLAERIPGARNTVYAVVFPKNGGAPFWTRSRDKYRAACFEGRDLAPRTVSRGFASQVELGVCFAGLGLPCPEEQ